MKLKNYNIILATVILIGIYGCKKDWLEAKADKTQAVPSGLKDYQAILDLTAVMNVNVFSLGEIAADGHYVTENAWMSATSNAARNSYTWSKQFSYSGLSPWTSTYRRVFYDNVVLEGLVKIKVSSSSEQAEYNNIKGQALFNRAEAFWILAQLFAQPYSENTASTDLGIPLRLNSDITEHSIRYSVKQTYEQIIKDCKEAAMLLPVKPVAPTRGSKPATYALLARTYLSMRSYDSARLYADECLQLFDTLFDFNIVLSTAGNLVGSGTFNPEVIFFTTMSTSSLSNFLTTNYLVETELYSQYGTNDLRRTRFFRQNTNGTITFKGNYNNSTTALFCGIPTDEIYLIRAECYARDSNTVAALDDLNVLLRKRWISSQPYQDITAISSFDALVKIIKERRKELVLRNIRWSDLRRLNQEESFKKTISRVPGGVTYTLEPNSYKYTFPIPDDIIEISGMPQTPGW